jgi:hypothetical protein
MKMTKDMQINDKLLSWTEEIGVTDKMCTDPEIKNFLDSLPKIRCQTCAKEAFEMRAAILENYSIPSTGVTNASDIADQVYDFVCSLLILSQSALLTKYIAFSTKPVNPSVIRKIRGYQEQEAEIAARNISNNIEKAMDQIMDQLQKEDVGDATEDEAIKKELEQNDDLAQAESDMQRHISDNNHKA